MREGYSVVESSHLDSVKNGCSVKFGSFQVSGSGVELDSFTAQDALEGKGDLD